MPSHMKVLVVGTVLIAESVQNSLVHLLYERTEKWTSPMVKSSAVSENKLVPRKQRRAGIKKKIKVSALQLPILPVK